MVHLTHLRKEPITVALACLLLAATPSVAGEARPKPKRLSPAQILARLVPLPDNAPREIINPYHARPVWKMWSEDPSPVTINLPHFKGTFKPPAADKRQYPLFAVEDGAEKLVYKPLKEGVAGFWDDCYISLDSHHTRHRYPSNQFIDGGKMRTAQDVRTILKLGTNFTSQSYSDRGRAIVDDIFNNLNTEKHFFFANCIRATPSHASYEDKEEDMPRDVYDGLYAHSYHSVGQSGSEMNAIFKMMIAGGAMPRATKNLLKKHGAYAIALLTIFKAALPYSDASGEALPYEHELRHRPAYSSNGTPHHYHYCPANAHYHGYSELLHRKNMLRLAREMKAPPPVAIARLGGFIVNRNGQTVTDKAQLQKLVKCVSLTNLRFHGKPGDILSVKVDLTRSYDLQKKALTFTCGPLYPNQKNIAIKAEAPGKYIISVKHDPKLPKGRIPIICTARNGTEIPSNPVFVNFYWPEEKEADDYFPTQGLPKDVRDRIRKSGIKRLPVNINKRPVVDLGLIGDAKRCKPGEKVSIKLAARDPEGFPISIYRRSGQMGKVVDGVFTTTIPTTDKEKIYRVHFIFSDGTGGYTGRQVKLLVAPAHKPLPKGWGLTALGTVSKACDIDVKGGAISMSNLPAKTKSRAVRGVFALREMSGETDITCRMSPESAGGELSMLVSNTPDYYSRSIRVGYSDGRIFGSVKPREQSWGETSAALDEKKLQNPKFFRIVYGNSFAGTYVSGDRKVWQQLSAGKIKLFRKYYGGIFSSGSKDKKPLSCELLPKSDSHLPIVSIVRGKRNKNGGYHSPATVSIDLPVRKKEIRYTTDGTPPGGKSPKYDKPFELTKPDTYEIRAAVFADGKGGDTVISSCRIIEPEKKKQAKKK